MRLEPGRKPEKRLAHLWNEANCIACGACVVACVSTNHPEMLHKREKGHGGLPSNIQTFEYSDDVGTPKFLMNQCQHCEDAPCVHTCPFGAVYYDTQGLVRLDERLCIGCSYCVAACPYDVRWKHPDNGLPKKCMSEGCLELVANGQKPSCVTVCPANARDFGDVDDPESSIAQQLRTKKYRLLLEDKNTKPKYFIVTESV
jgi:protein NrfC